MAIMDPADEEPSLCNTFEAELTSQVILRLQWNVDVDNSEVMQKDIPAESRGYTTLSE